jgi:hypothetical protein
VSDVTVDRINCLCFSGICSTVGGHWQGVCVPLNQTRVYPAPAQTEATVQVTGYQPELKRSTRIEMYRILSPHISEC